MRFFIDVKGQEKVKQSPDMRDCKLSLTKYNENIVFFIQVWVGPKMD